MSRIVSASNLPPLLRNGWFILLVAGAFEPLWLICMKMSEGFTQPLWSVATMVLLFISMYLLSVALKSQLPIGAAYSIWVGIGAIGALIAGIILFEESSDPVRLGFVLMIITGVMGVQITTRKDNKE